MTTRNTTLRTLCAACAERLTAHLHGGPDRDYCEECDTRCESPRLATYVVSRRRTSAARQRASAPSADDRLVVG